MTSQYDMGGSMISVAKGTSPMTRRGDEIKQRMNAVISKPRVSLDAGLFGQDVIVLTLQVTNNLREAGCAMSSVDVVPDLFAVPETYLASLSI